MNLKPFFSLGLSDTKANVIGDLHYEDLLGRVPSVGLKDKNKSNKKVNRYLKYQEIRIRKAKRWKHWFCGNAIFNGSKELKIVSNLTIS
jgi:hypothetical protein